MLGRRARVRRRRSVRCSKSKIIKTEQNHSARSKAVQEREHGFRDTALGTADSVVQQLEGGAPKLLSSVTWKEMNEMSADAKVRRASPLGTPTDLTPSATRDISGALTMLLADAFALYVKTKNFHWHMSGPHFRDYHLL